MPKWIKAKRLSAFTTVPYGGNPAWVIMGADDLSDTEMRRLANDLNPVSDTAFVFSESTKEADIFLRFFTGSSEVNFSGHAAIATYFALGGEDVVLLKEPETTIRQRTKTGIQQVKVRVRNNKIVWATMTLAKPNYMDLDVNPVPIAKFLGLTPNDINISGFPFDVISTGTYDLIVPVRSLNNMRNISPHFALMDSYCTRLDIQGIIVFCLETFEPGNTAFVRHFSPSLGVSEYVISGAAAGSLGCYLFRHKLLESTNFTRIVVEQGYLQQRQGKVFVHIEGTGGKIYQVWVGGNAVLTFTGYILTPS